MLLVWFCAISGFCCFLVLFEFVCSLLFFVLFARTLFVCFPAGVLFVSVDVLDVLGFVLLIFCMLFGFVGFPLTFVLSSVLAWDFNGDLFLLSFP